MSKASYTYEPGRGYHAKIILDSLAPCGVRLTTWELRYPRFVHAELMTHRLFSHNSASSRAIPTERLIAQVLEDPAMPVWWGKNQSGMQAREALSDDRSKECRQCSYPLDVECEYVAHDLRSDRQAAIDEWLAGRDESVALSRRLASLGLHKQIANRVIEPWMFITVLVSATTYDNWFALRDHPDAQPEIAWIARLMHGMYKEHKPRRLAAGQWHLPLVAEVDEEELRASLGRTTPSFVEQTLRAISVGRCARVSYLTHDGRRDPEADVALHNRLKAQTPGHWSPFEHVAEAREAPLPSGNFVGWRQYRKTFPGEHVGGVRP